MINPSTITPAALPSVSLSDLGALPTEPCIYFAIDGQGVVQYIGRSVNPQQRWKSHHRYKALSSMQGARIAYLRMDAELLWQVELALIRWFVPPLNGLLASACADNVEGLAVPLGGRISKVRELREANGLNQRQLAELVGVTETTVRNWENNRSGVDWFERVARLCKALGCSPADLVKYVEAVEGEGDE